MEDIRIIDTTEENIREFGVCGYKNIKRAGYPEKLEWLSKRFQEGMRVKTLVTEKDGTQGMIEYIPGEYCWRPVEAKGYMFVHCIFSGFKRIYKGKGYGSRLLEECVKDAMRENMHGVAIVTRKGSFMADKALFLKNGFEVVDKAKPDFELLVRKFNKDAPDPEFKSGWEQRLASYGKGLTIIRADQCPYTVKNVNEIRELAGSTFGLEPRVIDLKDHTEAQDSPSPFGTFCIIYDGKALAHHPISSTRFRNIMKKLLG